MEILVFFVSYKLGDTAIKTSSFVLFFFFCTLYLSPNLCHFPIALSFPFRLHWYWKRKVKVNEKENQSKSNKVGWYCIQKVLKHNGDTFKTSYRISWILCDAKWGGSDWNASKSRRSHRKCVCCVCAIVEYTGMCGTPHRILRFFLTQKSHIQRGERKLYLHGDTLSGIQIVWRKFQDVYTIAYKRTATFTRLRIVQHETTTYVLCVSWTTKTCHHLIHVSFGLISSAIGWVCVFRSLFCFNCSGAIKLVIVHLFIIVVDRIWYAIFSIRFLIVAHAHEHVRLIHKSKYDVLENLQTISQGYSCYHLALAMCSFIFDLSFMFLCALFFFCCFAFLFHFCVFRSLPIFSKAKLQSIKSHTHNSTYPC